MDDALHLGPALGGGPVSAAADVPVGGPRALEPCRRRLRPGRGDGGGGAAGLGLAAGDALGAGDRGDRRAVLPVLRGDGCEDRRGAGLRFGRGHRLCGGGDLGRALGGGGGSADRAEAGRAGLRLPLDLRPGGGRDAGGAAVHLLRELLRRDRGAGADGLAGWVALGRPGHGSACRGGGALRRGRGGREGRGVVAVRLVVQLLQRAADGIRGLRGAGGWAARAVPGQGRSVVPRCAGGWDAGDRAERERLGGAGARHGAAGPGGAVVDDLPRGRRGAALVRRGGGVHAAAGASRPAGLGGRVAGGGRWAFGGGEGSAGARGGQGKRPTCRQSRRRRSGRRCPSSRTSSTGR